MLPYQPQPIAPSIGEWWWPLIWHFGPHSCSAQIKHANVIVMAGVETDHIADLADAIINDVRVPEDVRAVAPFRVIVVVDDGAPVVSATLDDELSLRCWLMNYFGVRRPINIPTE